MRKKSFALLLIFVVLTLYNTVSATGEIKKSRPVSQVFHDFETEGYWMQLPQNPPNQNISLTTSNKHSGSKSMKLTYSFPETAEGGSLGIVPVEYWVGLPMVGKSTYMGIWICGDKSYNYFTIGVKDVNGEMLSFDTTIDWVGWKYIEFDLTRPKGFYGSASNGRIDFPAVVYSLTIGTTTSTKIFSGSVFYDSMCLSDNSLLESQNSEVTFLPAKTLIEKKTNNTPLPLQLDNNNKFYKIEKNISPSSTVGTAFTKNTDISSIKKTTKYLPYSANCMIDNDTRTYYKSQSFESANNTEVITLDLGAVKQVDEISFVPEENLQGFPKSFIIEVSSDNINWTQVIKEENYNLTQKEKQTFKFDKSKLQYIKISANELSKNNDGNYDFRLSEIQVRDFLDINYAFMNNGGSIQGLNDSQITVPKGYFDFYNNAKSIGRFYIKQGNYNDFDGIKENLKSIQPVLFKITNFSDALYSNLKDYVECFVVDEKDYEDIKARCNVPLAIQTGNAIKMPNGEIILLEGTVKTNESDYEMAKTILCKQLQYSNEDKTVLWDTENLFDSRLSINLSFNSLKNLSDTMVNLIEITNDVVSFSNDVSYHTYENDDNEVYIIYNSSDNIKFANLKTDFNIKTAEIIDPLCGISHMLNCTSNAIDNIVATDYPLIIKFQKDNADINMSDLAKNKLSVATVLKINSNTAFVNGKMQNIDTDKNIKVFFSNNVVWIPLRFIAESFGGQVDWNNVTYTTTVRLKDLEVKMVSGSKTAVINGETVYMDNLPIIKDGRTYISGDMMENLFNQYMVKDESGLIVISNQKYFFNSGNNSDLIDELVKLFD